VPVEFTVYLLRSVRLPGIFTLRFTGSQYRGTVPQYCAHPIFQLSDYVLGVNEHRSWFRRIVSLWIPMLVTVLSVPINHAHRDRSVEGAGISDVPQNIKQNICQNICLPDIRGGPVFKFDV
jgi:hypothetical protein